MTLRRSYGRKAPGKRFARAATVEEAKELVADKKETMVAVEPPKKSGVRKSKNVKIPVEETHDIPTLDKFMNLAHASNVEESEPEKVVEPVVVEEPEAPAVEEPVEQVLNKDEVEAPEEKQAEQVFEKKDPEATKEEPVKESEEVNVFVKEIEAKEVTESKPAKKKAPRKRQAKKVKTEKEKFSDDPLADDKPARRTRKKKKVVDDPLAD